MSRKFSNVLVICALVAVLGLLIAGTTLAVYYSIGNTVNAYSVFVDDLESANNEVTGVYAFVSCDSSKGKQADEEISVSLGHTTTATLTVDYSNKAYTFIGWFEGDKEAYATAVAAAKEAGTEVTLLSTDTEIEVSMEEDSAYCAVYQVKTYDITYSYKATYDAEEDTDETETVVYGASLKDLPTDDDYYFSGWSISEETGTTYQYATFTDTTVTLTGTWTKYTTVDLTVAAADATYTGTDKLSLKYAAGVSSSAVTTLESALNVSNWTANYSFWNVDAVTGITYNGTTYSNAEDLVEAIIDAGATEVTLTVELETTKYFTSVALTNTTYTCYAATSSVEENILLNASEYKETTFQYGVYYGKSAVNTLELSAEGKTNTTSTLNNYFLADTTTLYSTTDASNSSAYVEVELGAFGLNIGGESYVVVVSKLLTAYSAQDLTEVTVNDLIEYILQSESDEFDLGTTITFDSIDLYFVPVSQN